MKLYRNYLSLMNIVVFRRVAPPVHIKYVNGQRTIATCSGTSEARESATDAASSSKAGLAVSQRGSCKLWLMVVGSGAAGSGRAYK